MEFDPNAASVLKSNLFGLPCSPETAALIIIPIPWEVTTSSGTGTSNGPLRVLEASHQIDLYDSLNPGLWKKGISSDQFPIDLKTKGDDLQDLIKRSIANHEGIVEDAVVKKVNKGCEKLNDWVKDRALAWMSRGKLVGTLGGDHSTCFGLLCAACEVYEEISILQIDAHADFRVAYQGFNYSHASIMYNAWKLPQIDKLVSVGVRDYCEEEAKTMHGHENIICYYDQKIKSEMFEGKTWKSIATKIVSHLGKDVYLSFDVDGLSRSFCPGTGTPVPGGLEYEQALFLVKTIIDSGRKIIGFDISETGDGTWDGNVTARLLWRIAGMTI